MKELFDKNFVYPCDDTGEYIDLTGKIKSIDVDKGFDHIKYEVETEYGIFSGYQAKYVGMMKQPAGWEKRYEDAYYATIRIYRAGGGFYPDNRIIGVSAN